MSTPQLSLKEISDRIQIQDLLTRYTVAIDTKDWNLLDTCFTPDADVDYTATGGTKGKYPEVRKWLEMALAPFPITVHWFRTWWRRTASSRSAPTTSTSSCALPTAGGSRNASRSTASCRGRCRRRSGSRAERCAWETSAIRSAGA